MDDDRWPCLPGQPEGRKLPSPAMEKAEGVWRVGEVLSGAMILVLSLCFGTRFHDCCLQTHDLAEGDFELLTPFQALRWPGHALPCSALSLRLVHDGG